MTVQAGIEVDVDLELLVGAIEAPPCEHSQHQTKPGAHGGEAASHYVQGFCVCAGWSDAYAACRKFVTYIQKGDMNRCPDCGYMAPRNTVFKVLGPIGNTSK